MKSLKLFNVVLAKESDSDIYMSEDGYIIEPAAMWKKDQIIKFYEQKLSGNDLNKTFHKSWRKIKDSSRFELLMHQVLHYLSTYGSDFEDEVYIPNEVLEIPDVKLVFKTIKGVSKNTLIEKCLDLLRSGIALAEETLNDVMALLGELEYKFTGEEGIRNKEANVIIATNFNIYPKDPTEFFRLIIYQTTGDTLLIKNKETIEKIKDSKFNPNFMFTEFGVDRLSTIFNRFKPLFLAYKNKCGGVVNKISKLSKVNHKPLVQNKLNTVTQELLSDEDIHWLNNATPFALFKALNACYVRMNFQSVFIYNIRNGKSWAEKRVPNTSTTNAVNYKFILDYLKSRLDLANTKIYIPKNVDYAVPTSEKMYVGNIPTGTKITAKKLAVGVYWENEWGARDIDLSGINIAGKIGWNSAYNQSGNLMYSGDITNAPDGAVEYLYANKGMAYPTLIQSNIYSGEDTCGYKIVVGKGSNVDKNYMLDPNKLLIEVKTNSVQKQTILGLMYPEGDKVCFVVMNMGAGHCRISGGTETAKLATEALYQMWTKRLRFRQLVEELGAEICEDKETCDIDMSLETLTKDSFVNLFTHKTLETA